MSAERELRLTNLDRVLWPETGFTKGDLVAYYREVAPVLLPHLAGRPLTLGRFPEGVAKRGFAQMECRGRPDWMRTSALRLRSGEVRNYCVVDDVESLTWVANLSTIELHTYQFHADRPDRPIALTFDLDPGPGRGLLDACRGALLLREALAAHGLRARAKSSGATGVHVQVPLGSPHDPALTKAFAKELAQELAGSSPELLTSDIRPAARKRRVLIDWLQNEPRRSTVAPYSLRATPVPRVSTPLAWDELEAAVARGRADGLVSGPAEIPARIARRGDLYRPLVELTQELPGASRLQATSE